MFVYFWGWNVYIHAYAYAYNIIKLIYFIFFLHKHASSVLGSEHILILPASSMAKLLEFAICYPLIPKNWLIKFSA